MRTRQSKLADVNSSTQKEINYVTIDRYQVEHAMNKICQI